VVIIPVKNAHHRLVAIAHGFQEFVKLVIQDMDGMLV